MHAAGGPDAFLEDHAVIVCSDHSQSEVEDEIDLFRAFDGFGVLPPSGVRETKAGKAEIARLPELARGPGLRARSRGARDRWSRAWSARCWRSRASTSSCSSRTIRTARPPCIRATASCASPRAATSRTCAARPGAWTATRTVLALEVRDGRVRSARYPDALGARLVGAALPHGGRGARVRAGLGGSSWIGGARTTSAAARTARCTRTTRSARCCGAGPGPTSTASREQWTLRDVVPMVLDHFGLAA